MTRFEHIKNHKNDQAEHLNYLIAMLDEAVRIIRQAKVKFAPTTTNSDADYFLSQIDRKSKVDDDAV